jgi:hypothetical protein
MSGSTPASVAATAACPSRDDSETTPTGNCPVCARVFTSVGRQRYCQPACRKTAHRRRHAVTIDVTVVPAAASRRERTVYQCPECEGLQLGVQRCVECGVFGRSLGLGGHCPHCDEPVTLDDLDLTTA